MSHQGLGEVQYLYLSLTEQYCPDISNLFVLTTKKEETYVPKHRFVLD